MLINFLINSINFKKTEYIKPNKKYFIYIMKVNKIKANHHYKNLLLKIKHKPLIIGNLFSYLTKKPCIYFKLIEEDKLLKNKINTIFYTGKKNNDLSDILKTNINYILAYKNFKNSFNFKIIDKSSFFEEKNFEIYSDPSIISFLAKELLDKINKENNKSINYIPPSFSGMEEIINHIFEKQKSIQLVYLPKFNIKTKLIYSDGLYIENNLIKNSLNQEIDTLYCIIDDNQFYNQIIPIKNNIKIKKIYLIYIKGNKIINIYHAIKKYLSIVNNKYIEEIIFGEGFFKLEKIYFNDNNKKNYYYKFPLLEFLKEEVFINKKIIKVNSLHKIKININFKNCYNYLIFLGISLLFENANINGVITIDSKLFKNSDYEYIQPKNILLIKIHNLLFLENNSFMKIINQYINNKSLSIILFISEYAVKNSEKKYIFKYPCSFFYSELPIKNLFINTLKNRIEDDNKGLIIGNTHNLNYEKKNIANYLFLLRKFDTIVYKGFINFIIDSNKIIFYDFYESVLEQINLIKFINKNYSPINYIYCIKYNILYYSLDFDKNIKKIFMIYNYNDDFSKKDYILINKFYDLKFILTNCNLESTQNVLNFIKKNISKKTFNKNKKISNKNQINNSIYEDYLEEEEEDEEYYSEDDLY